MIIVGDVGGTNVRFGQAVRDADGKVHVEKIGTMPGDDFPSFEAALAAYVEQYSGEAVEGALFALAGPNKQDCIKLTNRDWHVSSAKIAKQLGVPRVKLVNDYAAMARAIPELPDTSFFNLHDGIQSDGPILVAGPGTGLGVATLMKIGEKRWHVLTGEGGHAAYAPSTPREWALAENLRARFGYVSKELVVAGIGYEHVYRALREIDGLSVSPIGPAELIEMAHAGDDWAEGFCRMRVRALYDALGDAALLNGTTGGVAITGGVALRLKEWLTDKSALSRFFERGPESGYMRDIPIRLLTNSTGALIGAAALYFDAEEQI